MLRLEGNCLYFNPSVPFFPFSFFLELAAEFNVSAERIRQIEQKAMQKMRSTMTA